MVSTDQVVAHRRGEALRNYASVVSPRRRLKQPFKKTHPLPHRYNPSLPPAAVYTLTQADLSGGLTRYQRHRRPIFL